MTYISFFRTFRPLRSSAKWLSHWEPSPLAKFRVGPREVLRPSPEQRSERAKTSKRDDLRQAFLSFSIPFSSFVLFVGMFLVPKWPRHELSTTNKRWKVQVPWSSVSRARAPSSPSSWQGSTPPCWWVTWKRSVKRWGFDEPRLIGDTKHMTYRLWYIYIYVTIYPLQLDVWKWFGVEFWADFFFPFVWHFLDSIVLR